ncbi:MAG: formylglycine-generating enzyme family protein [Phycisphaerales bacterium]
MKRIPTGVGLCVLGLGIAAWPVIDRLVPQANAVGLGSAASWAIASAVAAQNVPARCTADINGDGVVDGDDLGALLGAWGPCATDTAPPWASVLEAQPNAAVVTDAATRSAITATGWAWRVRDVATQIEMVLVPPGTYQMGCTASTQFPCSADESPVRTVTLTNAIYVARFEVTQAQWQARMGTNPSFFQGATYPDAATRPVEQVSWSLVQGFLTATGMRLLTEAEWEYACRAGTTTAFNNGSNDGNTATNFAWFTTNAGNQTKPVGTKAGNRFGIHDMHGNVWEWVSDWYATYPSTCQANPTGPTTGTNRVVRGGAWSASTDFLRSSDRIFGAPASVSNAVGFRVARTP